MNVFSYVCLIIQFLLVQNDNLLKLTEGLCRLFVSSNWFSKEGPFFLYVNSRFYFLINMFPWEGKPDFHMIFI
jgi:hypothetical protein